MGEDWKFFISDKEFDYYVNAEDKINTGKGLIEVKVKAVCIDKEKFLNDVKTIGRPAKSYEAYILALIEKLYGGFGDVERISRILKRKENSVRMDDLGVTQEITLEKGRSLPLKMQQTRIVLPLILVWIVILSSWAGGSNMDYYLGSEYKGNHVWGLAMNLAWHELNESILHEKLRLKTDDKIALRMADQFNDAPFTKNDLDEESYYIKSGYGQKTVDLINKESRVKFPGKRFDDLKVKLSPRDIIAYAYFLKKVEYVTPFKEKDVSFLKERVKGFYAKDISKENIRILEYWDDDKFIIRLTLKDDGDELILAKGFDMNNPKDALNEIDKYNKQVSSPINDADQFEMPKLHLDHQHDYIELTGKSLANKGFEEYFIAQMFEKIKFDMDHKGARVESEAIIIGPTAMPSQPKARRFILDKPFWVVLKRRDGQHPYFLLGVRNRELMEKVR